MQLYVNRAVGFIVRGQLGEVLPGRPRGQQRLQILDGVMRIVQPLNSARAERGKAEGERDGNDSAHVNIVPCVCADVKADAVKGPSVIGEQAFERLPP